MGAVPVQPPATVSGRRPALSAHPAARAYRRATSDRQPVAQVEEIQVRRRSQVFRIRWAGGGSVIAKRCRHHMAAVEQAAYGVALPRAREHVRVPALLGWLRDPSADPADPFTWLFIEDMGSRRYSPMDAAQRRDLARWLGSVNAAVRPGFGVAIAALPVRGAGYYRQYLQRAAEGIPALPARRRLPAAMVALTGRVGSALGVLQRQWPGIVAVFDSVPLVLVHGDCLPKNIHLAGAAGEPTGPQVVPIDWGNAGWGLPASDLGQSAVVLGDPVIGEACYEAYVQAALAGCPAGSADQVRRLAVLGRLLWSVKVLAMSVPGFRHDRLDKVECELSAYTSVLIASLREWDEAS